MPCQDFGFGSHICLLTGRAVRRLNTTKSNSQSDKVSFVRPPVFKKRCTYQSLSRHSRTHSRLNHRNPTLHLLLSRRDCNNVNKVLAAKTLRCTKTSQGFRITAIHFIMHTCFDSIRINCLWEKLLGTHNKCTFILHEIFATCLFRDFAKPDFIFWIILNSRF